MRKYIIFFLISVFVMCQVKSQDAGAVFAGGLVAAGAITYLAANSDTKSTAKSISQYRSKEYIINNIIGDTNGMEIQFETESLASDDSGGLITVAFNCDAVDKRGLLLAFIGDHRNEYGVLKQAYGYKYLPLDVAKELFIKIDAVKETNKRYLTSDSNVNNIFMEFEDMKFILYRYSGEDRVRVLWNGFQVIWERTAFDRSKRRLDRWFE